VEIEKKILQGSHPNFVHITKCKHLLTRKYIHNLHLSTRNSQKQDQTKTQDPTLQQLNIQNQNNKVKHRQTTIIQQQIMAQNKPQDPMTINSS
jgi:hypothetical protein